MKYVKRVKRQQWNGPYLIKNSLNDEVTTVQYIQSVGKMKLAELRINLVSPLGIRFFFFSVPVSSVKFSILNKGSRDITTLRKIILLARYQNINNLLPLV